MFVLFILFLDIIIALDAVAFVRFPSPGKNTSILCVPSVNDDGIL